MTSVRLSNELEKKLDKLANKKSMSRSAVIKEAIVQYLTTEAMQEQPYTLGESLFGNYSSGNPANSATYKNRFRSKLKSKHQPKTEI
jgi:metal-responsive CopG/Arc/MetJ family transcriptional regulator